jgi:glycosyltransferase involved in cell wall biosynthesis
VKTILFILPDLSQGGAEKVISILANEIDRKLFRPKIVLFEKKGQFLNDIKDDVEIIELKTKRIRFSIFKIIPLIFRLKPEIVFVGWGEISAFLSPFIPLFPKTRFIARETNVVSEHVKRKEIRFFYRFYKNFHRIIAQSDDMRNDLIQNLKIPSEKVIKINNPVDFEMIERKLDSRPLSGAETDLFNKNFKNVVATGSLNHRKGFDLLLNVFTHLKEKAIKLFIIGDGPEKENLIKQKEGLSLKNVEFLGRKENPYFYLNQADLFVLPSRYEGFPNVLLEAGACGVFALANDCPGGIREIIEPRINGEIADISDEKSFAERIWELAEKNYDEEMIKDSIRRRFSKESIVKQYNQILSEL